MYCVESVRAVAVGWMLNRWWSLSVQSASPLAPSRVRTVSVDTFSSLPSGPSRHRLRSRGVRELTRRDGRDSSAADRDDIGRSRSRLEVGAVERR
ncbi:hypothetical protein C9J85_18495 [Haloferax sp. wsp5]|nr:hypothetical protein C9J85_18495 [Haloferax sp. wsp5]